MSHLEVDRADQARATQAYHRLGFGAELPAVSAGHGGQGAMIFIIFQQKIVILTPFGSHFARF